MNHTQYIDLLLENYETVDIKGIGATTVDGIHVERTLTVKYVDKNTKNYEGEKYKKPVIEIYDKAYRSQPIMIYYVESLDGLLSTMIWGNEKASWSLMPNTRKKIIEWATEMKNNKEKDVFTGYKQTKMNFR